MRITKSRLKEIILEELDEGSREDMMMPAMSQSDLKIAELEERVERLEGMVGGGLEEGVLTENPIMAALGQMLKDPKVLAAIAQAIGPMLMKGLGKGGASAAAPAGGASALGAAVEE